MAKRAFRDLDKSVRRQRIVDAAVELFRKKGYRTTSLDDLARELKITKAALYHYVESKDELLFHIYTQAFNSIFQETHTIAAMNVPPDEKLRIIIRNHIKNIIIENVSLFFVFFTEENQLPDKYYRMVKDKKREYDRIIQGILEEGVTKGIFREQDPRLLGYAIVGMCNWLYKWYKPNGAYSADEIADQFIGILEAGYLRDGETHFEIKPEPASTDASPEGLPSPKLVKELKERCGEILDLLDRLD